MLSDRLRTNRDKGDLLSTLSPYAWQCLLMQVLASSRTAAYDVHPRTGVEGWRQQPRAHGDGGCSQCTGRYA